MLVSELALVLEEVSVGVEVLVPVSLEKPVPELSLTTGVLLSEVPLSLVPPEMPVPDVSSATTVVSVLVSELLLGV